MSMLKKKTKFHGKALDLVVQRLHPLSSDLKARPGTVKIEQADIGKMTETAPAARFKNETYEETRDLEMPSLQNSPLVN